MQMAAAQNQANKEEEEIKAKEKALVNAIAFKNHREMADAPTPTISDALKLMACRVETVVILSFSPLPPTNTHSSCVPPAFHHRPAAYRHRRIP